VDPDDCKWILAKVHPGLPLSAHICDMESIRWYHEWMADNNKVLRVDHATPQHSSVMMQAVVTTHLLLHLPIEIVRLVILNLFYTQ